MKPTAPFALPENVVYDGIQMEVLYMFTDNVTCSTFSTRELTRAACDASLAILRAKFAKK